MKTVQFCNLCPDKVGSFEVFQADLSREMKKYGGDGVVVFASEPADRVAGLFSGAGVRWSVIKGWSDGRGREFPWRFCIPAFKLILRERPDVVAISFGNELPALVVRMMAWLADMKDCRWVWIQHQRICAPGWFTARFSRIRLLSVLFDRIVALYEGGRQSLLARNVNPAKISVVYNGSYEIQPVRAQGWLRKELKIADNKIIIVCVSWLIPRKRIDSLIQAFAALLNRSSGGKIPESASSAPVLLLIGDGPRRRDLEQLSAELGVGSQVYFLGKRYDTIEILHESDIFVLTSIAEACPLSTLEAMSACLPAVVTDSGAAREQVSDGMSGYVVGTDDLDRFVERLETLVRNPELRKQMGVEARKRWEALFTSRKSAEGHYTVWRQLTGET
jgi:glycosyltransferase involved in cell wall biosynthesis